MRKSRRPETFTVEFYSGPLDGLMSPMTEPLAACLDLPGPPSSVPPDPESARTTQVESPTKLYHYHLHTLVAEDVLGNQYFVRYQYLFSHDWIDEGGDSE